MGYKERVKEFWRRKEELMREGVSGDDAAEQAKQEAIDKYFGRKEDES